MYTGLQSRLQQLHYSMYSQQSKEERVQGKKKKGNNKYVCYVSFVLYTDVGKMGGGGENIHATEI